MSDHIENSAVGSVEQILNDTKCINVGNIAKNDRYPLYDGNIIVYKSNKSRKRKNIDYFVDLQIKGVTKKIEKRLTFGIEVECLEKYLENGGVFYFVVQVDPECQGNNKVFYASLVPLAIKEILKNKNTQNKISVKIKPFPKNKEDVLSILYEFNIHRKKQTHLVNSKGVFYEDFNQICIPYIPNSKHKNEIDYLMNYNGYLYMQLNNIPLQAMKLTEGGFSIHSESIGKIKINEKTYFNNFEYQESAKTITFKFNNNLTIQLIKNNSKINFSLQPLGTISEILKSIEFLIDAFRSKTFNINGCIITLHDENKYMKTLLLLLDFYKKTKQTFKLCNISDDFYIEKLTEAEVNKIRTLINVLLEKQTITLEKIPPEYDIAILKSTFSFFKIILLAFKTDDGKTYRIEPFSNKLPLQQTTENGDIIDVSPFLLLKKEHLTNTVNLPFNCFLNDIKKHPINNNQINNANNLVLELLLAFDETNNSILLDTAIEICSWITETYSGTNEEKIVYMLNKLQAKVRKKPLSESDKEYLLKLTESENKANFKFAAATILNEKNRANIYWKDLDKETKNSLQKYPIYNLWKKIDDTNQ